MKVYISGPMTGLPEHNTPAFEAAAAMLRAAGHEVISPHELTLENYGSLEEAAKYPWEEHLKADLAVLPSVEAVVLLEGWEDSRGARLEVHVARELGLKVYDMSFHEVPDPTTPETPCPFGLESDHDLVGVTPYADAGDYRAGGIVVDPRTGAMKADGGKARPDLLPVWPLMETARVLEFGARKYADNNWRKGFDWSRVYGAALRHMLAFWGGEDLDPETGLSHLAHSLCCIMFLAEYTHAGTGNDDRWQDKEGELTWPH